MMMQKLFFKNQKKLLGGIKSFYMRPILLSLNKICQKIVLEKENSKNFDLTSPKLS